MLSFIKKVNEYSKSFFGIDVARQSIVEPYLIRILEMERQLDTATQSTEAKIMRCEERAIKNSESLRQRCEKNFIDNQAKIDMIGKRVVQLRGHVMKINDGVCKVSTETDILRTSLIDTKNAQIAMENDINEIKSKSSDVEARTTEMNKEYKVQLQLLNTAIKRCPSKSDLKEQLAVRDSKISELRAALENMKENIQDIINNYKVDGLKVNATQKLQSENISDISNQLTDKAGELKNLKNVVNQLKNELDSSKDQFSKSVENLSEMEKRLMERVTETIDARSSSIEETHRTQSTSRLQNHYDFDLELTTLHCKLNDMQGRIYKVSNDITKVECCVTKKFSELKKLNESYSSKLREVMIFKGNAETRLNEMGTTMADVSLRMNEKEARALSDFQHRMQQQLNQEMVAVGTRLKDVRDQQSQVTHDLEREPRAQKPALVKLQRKLQLLESESSKAREKLNYFETVLQKVTLILLNKVRNVNSNVSENQAENEERFKTVLKFLEGVTENFSQVKDELHNDELKNSACKWAIEASSVNDAITAVQPSSEVHCEKVRERGDELSDSASKYSVAWTVQPYDAVSLQAQLKLELPPESPEPPTPRRAAGSHKRSRSMTSKPKRRDRKISSISQEDICRQPIAIPKMKKIVK